MSQANQSADQPIPLRELLPSAEYFPQASNPSGCTLVTDPSSVNPGDLYVHLEPIDSVGAEWAAERGAAAIVTDRVLPGIIAPQAVVDDIRVAHQTLSKALGVDAQELLPPLITVGGSAGRSTVAELVSAILLGEELPTGVKTSDIEADGFGLEASSQHDARSLSDWHLRCGNNETLFAVLATPAGQPAPRKAPAVACLTTLRCDGLDSRAQRRWPSHAAHQKASVQALGRLSSETTLVTSSDDADSLAHASSHPGTLLTFGEAKQADVRGLVVEEHAGGQVFILSHGRSSVAVSVEVTGGAFRRNCLAAAATCVAIGLPLDRVARGLERALPRCGMAERVVCGQAFPILLDRAKRPEALREALAATRTTTEGRVLAAIRLVEDEQIAMQQIAAAERLADRVLIEGPAPEDLPLGRQTTRVEDRLQALALAIGLAETGDSVLLAGYAPEENDRELIEQLVEQRLAHMPAE